MPGQRRGARICPVARRRRLIQMNINAYKPFQTLKNWSFVTGWTLDLYQRVRHEGEVADRCLASFLRRNPQIGSRNRRASFRRVLARFADAKRTKLQNIFNIWISSLIQHRIIKLLLVSGSRVVRKCFRVLRLQNEIVYRLTFDNRNELNSFKKKVEETKNINKININFV